jgi:hypothetical protein
VSSLVKPLVIGGDEEGELDGGFLRSFGEFGFVS